jgi:hypothetical protein
MRRLLSIGCVVVCVFLYHSAAAGPRAQWSFVDFDPVKHQPERELVLRLNEVKQEALYVNDVELKLFIALADMNGDGVKEIFALFRHPDFCGTRACEFQTLLRGSDGIWRSVTEMGTSSTAIALGPYHNGYRDMLFHGGGPGRLNDLSCPVWQHNGTAYDLKYHMGPNRWPCREATARYYMRE